MVLGGKSELILSPDREFIQGFGKLFWCTGDDVAQEAAPKGGTSALANVRRRSVAEP